MKFSSSSRRSQAESLQFQPAQIVCLEHDLTRLYAEVVQIVEARNLCWVRPLVLVVEVPDRLKLGEITPTSEPMSHTDAAISNPEPQCYNLSQAADLLWPTPLFRPALDMEVIPWLSHPHTTEVSVEATLTARHQFDQFIRQTWQAHPDIFSELSARSNSDAFLAVSPRFQADEQ